MAFRGEAKIFSNESLINSSVPRRPPRGFVTSYYPRWGGLRDKPKEPLKAREAVNKGVEERCALLLTLYCVLLNVIITNFSLNVKEKELGKTQENQLRTKEQSTRKQSKLKLHKSNHKTREKDKHQLALVKKNP